MRSSRWSWCRSLPDAARRQPVTDLTSARGQLLWSLSPTGADAPSHAELPTLHLDDVSAIPFLVGISGVVAYTLADQLREVGIRMVLGAEAASESARVVRHALRPILMGAAVGSVVAFMSRQVLSSSLYGVRAVDPSTYVGVVLLLLVSGALAAWIPARRASAVDPMRVLSEDA